MNDVVLPDLNALPDSALLDESTTAAVLDMSPGTLSVWRCTGRHDLPFVKIGRKVRYRAGDLRAWLARHTCTNTGGGK